MSFFHSAWMALRSLFKKDVVEAELDKEMRFHLEMQTQHNIEKGMDPTTAKREALKSFGGFDKFKEESREAWGVRVVTDLIRDIRYSFHSLRKSKGFSLAVIITLALCIGANTTVLSALYGLVLKPLPFENPDRLVQVFNVGRNNPLGSRSSGSGWRQYLDYQERTDLLEGLALRKPVYKITLSDSSAFKISGQAISADFFDLLRVQPLLGRFFLPEEVNPQAQSLIILTQTYWESEYGSDPSIIGKQIHFHNGAAFTVVGVAPRSVEVFDSQARFFVPYQYHPRYGRYGDGADLWLRLKADVSREVVEEQLRAMETYSYEHAASPEERAHYEHAFERLELGLAHPLADSLSLLEGGAIIVLFVGCLNIINLLLNRAGRKCHELSIRNALGGSKLALRRLMVAEMSLLGSVALAVGLILAWGSLSAVNEYVAILDPLANPINLDTTILISTVGVTIGLVCLMGFIPFELLWKTGVIQRVDSSQRVASSGTFTRKLGSALVVGQVAFAFALLIGAGLLLRSFYQVLAVDPGFETTRVVKARIQFGVLGGIYKRSETAALKDRIVEGLKEIPGVEGVSVSQYESFMPRITENIGRFEIRGLSGDDSRYVIRNMVSPDFLSTMGMRLLDGRDFNQGDTTRSVFVVDEVFAKRFFEDGVAVGSEMALGSGPPWGRIIGVATRANLQGLEQRDGLPVVYYVLDSKKNPWGFTIFVRTSHPPELTMRDMRVKLQEIDGRIPLSKISTLQQALDNMLLDRKGLTLLFGSFAGLALFLSVIGIYAVLAYDVSRRRREIGVRSAIGASRSSVLKMILRQGLGKAGLGLGLGLLASLYLSRFLEGMLFDVVALDPWTYATVCLVFLSVALAASYLPARRAVRVDPLEALRSE